MDKFKIRKKITETFLAKAKGQRHEAQAISGVIRLMAVMSGVENAFYFAFDDLFSSHRLVERLKELGKRSNKPTCPECKGIFDVENICWRCSGIGKAEHDGKK